MANELIPGNSASGSDTVNEKAMYSAVMYLPLDDLELSQDPAPTLKDILDEAKDYSTDPSYSAEERATAALYVNTITAMAGELKIDPANVTMNNPSWESGREQSYGKPEGFMGVTFTNGDTTIIAFRGTPGGA